MAETPMSIVAAYIDLGFWINLNPWARLEKFQLSTHGYERFMQRGFAREQEHGCIRCWNLHFDDIDEIEDDQAPTFPIHTCRWAVQSYLNNRLYNLSPISWDNSYWTVPGSEKVETTDNRYLLEADGDVLPLRVITVLKPNSEHEIIKTII